MIRFRSQSSGSGGETLGDGGVWDTLLRLGNEEEEEDDEGREHSTVMSDVSRVTKFCFRLF